MDSSFIVLGGVAVVMAAILVYVVLMIFLPEWVGITGKAALDAERCHAEENPQTAVSRTGTHSISNTDNKILK